MAETFDYSGDRVVCIQRLVARGTDDCFLMFLQGLDAKPETETLWVSNSPLHGTEVTIITPSEFLEYRNQDIRLSLYVADQCLDENSHERLDSLLAAQVPFEVMDTIYGFQTAVEGQVIHLN